MDLAEEIVGEKIELAVLHFRSGNYAKCLLLYNEVVQTLLAYSASEVVKVRTHYQLSPKPILGTLVHPKLASVLDQRAATYEKLDDVENALKDAQKIVSADPLNCKGYLRMGKLYLKQKKTVDAYKIYQRGVYVIERAREKHQVEVATKLFQQLKDQYKKLNRHLKDLRKDEKTPTESSPGPQVAKAARLSSASIQRRLDDMLPLKRAHSLANSSALQSLPQQTVADPRKKTKKSLDIFQLPPEIVESIFGYLPIRTVLRCHLVCKNWYHGLTSLPRLYKGQFVLKHRITAPEYFQGLRLMKKILHCLFSKSIDSLRVWSTFNSTHLRRIVDSIIQDPQIKLKRLALVNRDFSIEYFLGRLDKNNWSFDNLATITHLKFGINSSIIYPAILLLAFPNLVSLEVVIIDKVLRKTNKQLLPYNVDNLNRMAQTGEKIESQTSLESLSLINHPELTREMLQVPPSQNSFSVKAPFLNIAYPNLTKLTVVNFDFKNMEAQFGGFLSHCTGLQELYLENNETLSVKCLFMILRLYSPSFVLKKLTIREKSQDLPYSLTELDEDVLTCLFDLEHLDVYGSCLSNRGLLKLLRIANRSWNLRSLNIGNSLRLCFPQDKFLSSQDVVTFSQIFQIIPSLTSLYLNELDLDNMSMRKLHQDLVAISGYENCRLKKIDLLFCHNINGVGLMNLVNASYSQTPNTSTLMLDELVLYGLDINKETLHLLKMRDIVKLIVADPFRTKWRQYGINSYVQET